MPRILVAGLLLFALAPAATATAPVPAFTPQTGKVTLTFDPAFGLKLVKLGVNAGVVAPAKQDSLVITLPVRPGGQVSEQVASVRTRGGFELDDPADDVNVTLTRIAVEITGRRLALSGFALIDGTGYDRFAFADGRVGAKRVTDHRLRVRRATLRLNGVAVAALNSQLATTDFQEGDRIGTIAVRVSGG